MALTNSAFLSDSLKVAVKQVKEVKQVKQVKQAFLNDVSLGFKPHFMLFKDPNILRPFAAFSKEFYQSSDNARDGKTGMEDRCHRSFGLFHHRDHDNHC